MLKTAMEMKVRDLQNQAQGYIYQMIDVQKHFMSNIIWKLNNLVNYNVFAVPGTVMGLFLGSSIVSEGIKAITGSVQSLVNSINGFKSITSAIGTAIGTLSAGVNNFNALLNYTTSSIVNNTVQHVMNWPSEWVRVDNYTDPVVAMERQGWVCFRDMEMCAKGGEMISFDELYRRSGRS